MDLPPRLRSILFVPADSDRKLAKAPQTGADAIVLDLEDSVPESNKAAARERARRFIESPAPFHGLILVRCHAASSPEFSQDCELLRRTSPHGIVLPKCRSAAEVEHLEAVLGDVRCWILPMVESAEGLLQSRAIARSSPRVIGVAFGAEDFSADTGIAWTSGEPELLYARSSLVVACRASGVDPIDTPCLDYRDDAGVRAAAQAARNLGFSGKLAIHPMQVPILNEVFHPTAAEAEEARRIVAALSESDVAGLEGRMIDAASLRRARRILQRAGS